MLFPWLLLWFRHDSNDNILDAIPMAVLDVNPIAVLDTNAPHRANKNMNYITYYRCVKLS